jgi:hypothetical protein
MCEPCGDLYYSCCPNNVCEENQVCDSTYMCVSCGLQYYPCCANNTCRFDFKCIDGTCGI